MRTVLIVDDDSISRELLKNLLSSEYSLIEAQNGREALEVMYKMREMLSAVLLDIVMPELDGYTVLEKMRKNPLLSQIPAIVVTSCNDEDTYVKALALGANDFVTKPYNPVILKHCLSNSIALRESAAFVNSIQRDKLTKLYNRETFYKKAEALIASHEPGYYVLSCSDIENFKLINDQYGTDVGDEVLRHIASCMKGYVEAVGGIASRVSADNFFLLFPSDASSEAQLSSYHNASIYPPCLKNPISIKVGRYTVSDLTLSFNAMVDRALLAQRSIKGKYGQYVQVYDESMRSKLIFEQQIVADMDTALSERQFEAWYQPQYNHATGALIGAEALARWRHPEKGLIPPGNFIPVFERSGFIFELDKYIWEEVCQNLRRWLDEGRSPLPVSVNVSRFDVFHSDIVELFKALIEKYSLPVELLRIEITESAFSESDKELIRIVKELINFGFTVEIDDFGSGYSSLNTLNNVPAQILKLDMKFFEKTDNSQRSGNIIESVVRMAKWLGMAVIAEGVEDKEQADYLKSIGCYYIQGYFYAKPMPLQDYEKLLIGNAKEPQLVRLKTVDTWDNSAFWDAKSMETLIFNSYVGGACIFEYHGGKLELLRVNKQYAQELGQLTPGSVKLTETDAVRYLDNENKQKLYANIRTAIRTRHEASCELVLSNGVEHTEYIRTTVRVIARAGERFLFYCVIVNITKQREAELRQREAELKENESAQQLQIIMSNINGGVSAIIIDEKTATSKLVFANERYYGLFGYTAAQAEEERLDMLSLILPEDKERVMAEIAKLKKNRTPLVIDYRCKRRDGKLIYIRVNASLMNINGDEDVITSVITDVTEQKELSDRLKAIVDSIDGGVSITHMYNGKPKITIENDRFYSILGYTKEQFEAECKGSDVHIHPDDRERVIKEFVSTIASPRHYALDYRVIRRDGAIRYIHNNVSVMHLFGSSQPIQLSVATDVTEQREAQIKARSAVDKLNTVLNHVGSGITAVALYESSPKLLLANDRFYKLLGCTREEYDVKTDGNWLAFVHSDDREAVLRAVRGTKHAGQSATVEFRVTRPDKRVVWLKTVITITRLSDIEPPVQIGVFSDITAEHEANEQLRFLNSTAHDILSQPDSGLAVTDTLSKLVEYFSSDRAYVVELNSGSETFSATYEHCIDGVESLKARLQDYPFKRDSHWVSTLMRNECLIINDVSMLMGGGSELGRRLVARGVNSMIIAPLRRDGRLIGYVT